MLAILQSLGMCIIVLFKSRRRLEAENLFLRHQLSIALRRAPPRLRLRGSDRALLVWMTRLWPSLLGAAQVLQPETTGSRRRWTLEEKQRIVAESYGTAAGVGDGAAEWAVCEPAVHVAPSGPRGADVPGSARRCRRRAVVKGAARQLEKPGRMGS